MAENERPEDEMSTGADNNTGDDPLADEWASALQEQDTGSVDDEWAAALAEAEAAEQQKSTPEKKAPMQQQAKVRTAPLETFDDDENPAATVPPDLDVILDIPVTISMEVGATQIAIRNLLQLNQGSVIELDRLAGEPLDVLVNGTLIAHGEVVMVNEKFGIRLTDVVSPSERIKKLR